MNELESRMAALRARFAAAAPAEAERLARALDADDWGEVRRIAHGLAGRAGMFGFDGVGAAALRADEAGDADLRPAALALLASLEEVGQGR